jgi:stage II sporulation protein D
MSGVVLRKRLGLNSNYVRFKFFEEELTKKFPIKKGLIVYGQGSGHGVGMSQWGAKYLASRGKKS